MECSLYRENAAIQIKPVADLKMAGAGDDRLKI